MDGCAQLNKKVAVIGAGYAGMAAAVALIDAGHEVTVFETSR
ncbi:MAG TPA: FAD-dependent oxidoreductase, partial [Rhodocyclaceae bacterium]|nr:FAD-dependent oxidoreductase [Rhodocyclaceae bacterium]